MKAPQTILALQQQQLQAGMDLSPNLSLTLSMVPLKGG